MEEALTALELYNMGKNYLAIRNYSEAQVYLTKAVMKGSGKAGRDLMRLGQIYADNGDAEALTCFQVLANHGSVEACLLLGGMYRDGVLTKRSIDLAFDYFGEAYRLGSARAAYEAGMLIWPDVFRDNGARECAKEWFRAAAEEGYDPAYLQEGLLFCDDSEKQMGEALEWFGKAADKGDVDAMMYAANIHLEGQGVPQDFPKAISFLERASEAGSIKADQVLADIYGNGPAKYRDKVKALEYRTKVRLGHERKI
jgi:uncharacterized protein